MPLACLIYGCSRKTVLTQWKPIPALVLQVHTCFLSQEDGLGLVGNSIIVNT